MLNILLNLTFLYEIFKIFFKESEYMDLKRINELAKKQREVGLSEEEIIEQSKLRREYIDAFKANLKSQLENIVIVDEKGNRKPLKKK